MSAAAGWRIGAGDAGYPSCLRELGEAVTPGLHGVGRRSVISGFDNATAVTIVGARRASGYGLRAAEAIARELATAGVTIVSGMALGIDAAAHRGALAGAGTTVAVLAGGPDLVYPAMHRDLYREIVASGAVISEYPPGTAARKQNFPARNRIMAALGGVVLIVEAAQPSGSLITAEVAARIGRTVGAVPGQVGVGVAAGTNQLIKDGAHLVRDARDVLDLLFGVGSGGPRRHGPELEAPLRAVLDLVEAGAVSVDRISVGAEIAPREAAVALARLELLGYVCAGAAGDFRRSGLAPP